MGEARNKRIAAANRDYMRPVRILVNLVLLATLPIWGGVVLLGTFIYEGCTDRRETHALIKGEKWMFQ